MFVWSVTLYGGEMWTLRKKGQKQIEAFEMSVWWRMEGIDEEWRDSHRVKKVMAEIENGKKNCIDYCMRRVFIHWWNKENDEWK